MKLEDSILKKEIEIKYCLGSQRVETKKDSDPMRPIYLHLKTNIGLLLIKLEDLIKEFNEPFKIKYVIRTLAERLKWDKEGDQYYKNLIFDLLDDSEKEEFFNYRSAWRISVCLKYFKNEKYNSRESIEDVTDDIFKIISTKSFESVENFETQLDIYKFCHTVVPSKEWNYFSPDVRGKLFEESQKITKYASDEIKLISEVE